MYRFGLTVCTVKGGRWRQCSANRPF